MGARLPQGDEPDPSGRLPEGIAVSARTPLSAYVHIPFCAVRCGYCDFNTYTSSELRGVRREDYANDLSVEIDLAARVLSEAGPSRELATVFFGGGTPTLMPASHVVTVLTRLRERFGVADQAEVTIEANPDTLDSAYVDALAGGGITRLSIGMQSAVPHVLATLDRTHDARRIPEVVAMARDAGLATSVDLIYGTPGESLDDWKRTLDAVADLDPTHVSAYALSVEEGTALARQITRGILPAVDDDLQADMYEVADAAFAGMGLSWYEISNWSRDKNHQSQHNLAYWRNHDWWGFGPGAHSHVSGVRFWNVRHPAAYQQRLAEGLSPAQGTETLDRASTELEAVMLGIRLSRGLTTAMFDSELVSELVAEGLAHGEAARNGHLMLTLSGRLRADEVTRRLTS